MIAIAQPNDLAGSIAILSNGKTVKATHSSLMRIFTLWVKGELVTLHHESTKLALITILARKADKCTSYEKTTTIN